MSPALFVVIGAALFGILGSAHLIYTFFTPRFEPRDAACGDAMRATSPRLTGQTTMWKAWIGFNASHSLGAIVFAAVYLGLALRHPAVLAASPFFVLLALANALGYLALARAYWFRTPFIGILVATLSFAIATLLVLI